MSNGWQSRQEYHILKGDNNSVNYKARVILNTVCTYSAFQHWKMKPILITVYGGMFKIEIPHL